MEKEIKNYLKWGIVSLIIIFNSSCVELDKNPLDQLSTGSFWKNESDANLALVGVYRSTGTDFWSSENAIAFDCATDNAYSKNFDGWHDALSLKMTPNNGILTNVWNAGYKKIAKCNNFLENIGKADMDEIKKREMIAEVRFIRAYQYFWLTNFFGDIPLVTKVLDFNTANHLTREPKTSIISFLYKELSESAVDLPTTRIASQKGRVVRGAALAMKGRLLMSEKAWSEAATTFKQIIDMGVFKIDPNYQNIFLEAGEKSNEIILAAQYLPADYSWGQRNVLPSQYQGGFATYKVVEDLVGAYLMKDGKAKENSPLYNQNQPFINRDPRLYYSIFLPGFTKFQGKTYQAHPDSINNQDKVPLNNSSGYYAKKFIDESSGAVNQYGGDIILIRYAEVLLNYLEAKLESGDNIDQNLLDLTINQLRLRQSVSMPKVNDTNPVSLKEILRNERRIELAFEGPLRIWDLMRWRIAHDKLKGKFYGMKITNDPGNYKKFEVNENGNVFVMQRIGMNPAINYLWPIPQSERDINGNLTQNTGY